MFDPDLNRPILIPQDLDAIFDVMDWFDDAELQTTMEKAGIRGKLFLGTPEALESFITQKMHESFGSSAYALGQEFKYNPDKAIAMLLDFSEKLSKELFPYLQPRFIMEDNTNPPCPYPIGMIVHMANVWKNKNKIYPHI